MSAHIEGASVRPLAVFQDARGRLMEILRRDDKEFTGFGQVYMTTAYPGVVKAWHFHMEQDDNFTVVVGGIRLVLFDGRVGSPTHGNVMELFLSEHKPMVVHIPRRVVHGFQVVGNTEAVVINTVSEPYNRENPDEHRIAPDDPKVPFDWYKSVDG